MKYFIPFIFVLSIWSCVDQPADPLSRGERRHVDTLIAQHQTTWRAYYDSVCLIQSDSLVSFYYDSILRLEIKAIQKLEQ